MTILLPSIWTFADPWLTHTADPRHDLDMTSTALVKTRERGHGTEGLPWEPKQSFAAVASFYAGNATQSSPTAPDPASSP